MSLAAPAWTAEPQPEPSLPDWVTDAVNTKRRWNRANAYLMLNTVAHHATVEHDGSFTGARLGANDFITATGLVRSTVWDWIGKLERLGVLVTLDTGTKLDGKQLPNMYGIPGHAGALDVRKKTRRKQVMEHTGGGIYRPRVMTDGEQLPMFAHLTPNDPASSAPDHDGAPCKTTSPEHDGDANDPPPGSMAAPDDSGGHTTPPSEVRTTPSPKAGLPPVRSPDYPPSEVRAHHGNGHGMNKTHGHGASQSRGKCAPTKPRRLPPPPSAPSITSVTRLDLEDDERLAELWRQARTRSKPLPNLTRVNFYAAAERALRITKRDGGDAGRLFGSLVWRGHYQTISNADEVAAEARIVNYDRRNDPSPKQTRGASAASDQAKLSRPTPPGGGDVAHVNAARAATRDNTTLGMSAFRALKQADSTWTLTRFREADAKQG